MGKSFVLVCLIIAAASTATAQSSRANADSKQWTPGPHPGSCMICHYSHAKPEGNTGVRSTKEVLSTGRVQVSSTVCATCHDGFTAPAMSWSVGQATNVRGGQANDHSESDGSGDCTVCHDPHLPRSYRYLRAAGGMATPEYAHLDFCRQCHPDH